MTKVISLSEEAYKKLRKRKGKGQSFSDVVIRISKNEQSKSILEFAGGWVGEDASRIAQRLRQERKEVKGREYKP